MRRYKLPKKKIKNKCKKRLYLSFESAHNASLKYFVRFGGYSFPYGCIKCKKFHLTTKIYTE